jgi:hypothetical protein
VKKKINDYILNNYNELFFAPRSKPASQAKNENEEMIGE